MHSKCNSLLSLGSLTLLCLLALIGSSLAGQAQTAGRNPAGTLCQGKDGYLYGTTHDGGAHNLGTVFKITTAGALTKLHDFAGTDGANPCGGLVQASDGNLYGTTYDSGMWGYGTIYQFGKPVTTLFSFN